MRHRLWIPLAGLLALAALGAALAAAQGGGVAAPPATTVPAAPPDVQQPANVQPPPAVDPPIAWRPSRALGKPFRKGRLIDGVQLPEQGVNFFTWDPVLNAEPNRPWRRWGTDTLVRTVLSVIAQYRVAHPEAPRVGVADLSRPHGGAFGKRYGGLGHASHQNGLDADVYYPRLDRLERRPPRPAMVDRRLAQDLVDRFVAAGAQYVFVGPRLRLRGPRGVVVKLRYHDDHLHVRIHHPVAAGRRR